MKIYALYHIYDDIVEEITYKQIKRIGYFKTKEECRDIIKIFKTYVGFRDYPELCLEQSERRDKIYENIYVRIL